MLSGSPVGGASMTASPTQVIPNRAIRAACHVIAAQRLMVWAKGIDDVLERIPLDQPHTTTRT
jgi:hypothetical protein